MLFTCCSLFGKYVFAFHGQSFICFVALTFLKDVDDPLLKYPIDEAWLPAVTDLPPFPQIESAMCLPPNQVTNYSFCSSFDLSFVTIHQVGPFVVLWDFVAAFSRKIEVSPFSMEDLEASA